MFTKRSQKLCMVLIFLVLLGVVVSLVLYALRQNISLFYSPSQLHTASIPNNRLIRVGGMVMKHSVIREPGSLMTRFVLTDYAEQVTVVYSGVLPDLFREGQGVVVKGKVSKDNVMMASEVLAKHDEKYMPPEVKATLRHEKG